MKQSSRLLGNLIKSLAHPGSDGAHAERSAGLYGWGYYTASTQSFSFKTEKTVKGDLVATVSSTGTIEPEEVVDVGSQLSLQVKSFGPDPEDSTGTKTVDWRTNVNEGSVLAYLDDALYQAKAKEAEATVKSAEADVNAKKATLAQADREWQRNVRLKSSGGVSNTDYDTAQANFETATATLGVSQAALGLAQSVAWKKPRSILATPSSSRPSRASSSIAASTSARPLWRGSSCRKACSSFARDLSRVQVWVSVNESDIGNIQKGQKATFTVDAFPGEEFTGEVTKVRLNATMTQNVVTYTVEVTTPNKDLRLLPYLTANVKFYVDKREGVKLVPNGALRWKPPAAHVHPDFRTDYEQALKRKAVAATDGGDAKPANADKNPQNRGTVWVEYRRLCPAGQGANRPDRRPPDRNRGCSR